MYIFLYVFRCEYVLYKPDHLFNQPALINEALSYLYKRQTYIEISPKV
ncbi:hypothetical protein SAMN04487911_11848 [Arenibacter nanhaiticus]|uniref:Uncharacterized protein n=1 Tax=Arenibacter nanhaiticus TaxID=558155 RepID=A0A1M6IME1_9FLAO|nr:hypothetical protein SAMN04487911_11848 [Arenibacter nanhaiticus]